MSERQLAINNEVLYFIATGENTTRSDIDRTFDNYLREEVDTAISSLTSEGCIDRQESNLLVTPIGRTRIEEYKKTLPRTVSKF
jgi:hypothetical protein